MSAAARRASGSASIRNCPTKSFAEIVVVSKDVEARERIKARLEKAVADGALSEARVRVDRFNFGPPVGFPVQFRVIGPDTKKVRDIAYQVREVMRADDKVIDPHLDWNEQAPYLKLVVDQDRVRAMGLTPQDIAQSLSMLISGVPITTVRDGIEKVAVVARAVPSERLDLAHIGDLSLYSRNGVAVPLSQIAHVEYSHEEPILWRINRDMAITVRADVVDGVQPPDVTNAIWPKLQSIRDSLEPAYRIEIGGAIEESQKGNASIFVAVPADDLCHADALDDPAAEHLAADPGVPHRAARHHRRFARIERRQQAVRLRRAARTDRADGHDHAQRRDPGRPDRNPTSATARPAGTRSWRRPCAGRGRSCSPRWRRSWP